MVNYNHISPFLPCSWLVLFCATVCTIDSGCCAHKQHAASTRLNRQLSAPPLGGTMALMVEPATTPQTSLPMVSVSVPLETVDSSFLVTSTASKSFRGMHSVAPNQSFGRKWDILTLPLTHSFSPRSCLHIIFASMIPLPTTAWSKANTQ